MPRTLRAAALLLALLLLAVPGAGPAAAVTWTRVSASRLLGISGLTATPSGWLVVHDAKAAGQTRVSLLSGAGVLTPLTWPGTAPSDLEAVDGVPGRSGQYAAVTSGGGGSILSVSGTRLTVVRSFALPTGRTENEGFALATIGSATVAVWGNRGSSTTPGRLYAAVFDPATATFGTVTSATVTVPYPTGNVRHISDVEVRSGRLYVASASDGGDRGPFASAVYFVGRVSVASGRARLAVTTPVSLGTYPDHKIEGLACTAGGGRVGTDDEALGGYVASGDACAAAAAR